MTARLLQGLGAAARGGLAAWLSLLALALFAAPNVYGPATYLALIGASNILPFGGMLALAALLAWAPRSSNPEGLSRARALGLLALEAGIALASVWLLRRPLEALVPSEYAYRELIASAAAAHLGVGLSLLAGAVVCWRATGKLWSFPLWTAIPLHLAARIATHEAVSLFAPGRELALDAATALWCLIAGVRPRRSALDLREVRVLVPAMIAALGCTATVAALRPGAVAELVTEFPGPGGAFARVRSIYDLDGDGFPGVLGGHDCDDANLRVGPMALEIVGNGVDDNCMGGDLAAPRASSPATFTPGAPRRNLILIVVDTLRADALAHGRAPAPMPNTERMAAEGAVFRRAYAHAPYTGQALRSLNSGEYPMNMLAFEVPLGMGPTLAERLHAIGYETSAIVQFDEVSMRTRETRRSSNLLLGFSRVDWKLREVNRDFRAITSPALTDAALGELTRLRATGRPYVLWLHYFDPHAEYQAHTGTPFESSSLAGRYWQEVYATDRELGRLYAALEAERFFDNGVLALTGDHGELLGENGRFQHAMWLDELAIRVPLVVRGPGVPAGRYDTRVRHVDLAPTLLDLAAGMQVSLPGRHLAEVWSGRSAADRDVVATTTYHRRVIKRAFLRGSHKLVVDLLAGGMSLYEPNGAEDGPNLADQRPDLARELEVGLGQVWDEAMNDRVLAGRRAAVAANAPR